jgi:hypothetical protein
MSKLSGLVNVFTMVLQLVHWWWWCCCLFLCQCMRVKRSTTQVAAAVEEVAVVAAVDDKYGVQWRRQHSMAVAMDYG